MRALIVGMMLAASVFSAAAQDAGLDAPPDLTGTWTGKAQSVIFGNNAHLPGGQTVNDPARFVEVPFTYEIVKQEGRTMWGWVYSDPAKKEPIALAFSFDNGTILGADSDGYHRLTVISPDRMESCFTMNGLSPTGSIVASCYLLDRVK